MSGNNTRKHSTISVVGAKGYTLIELAIVLLIVGLFLASGATYYAIHTQKEAADKTINAISLSTDMIHNFRTNNGRFPCPAPLTVARTDPNYGKETICNGGAIAAMSPGDCANGICVEEGIRANLPDGTPLTPLERRVIVGALPFRTLQISESDTFDGYGSRIIYAVSLETTSQATYDEQKGAIAVRDANGTPLTQIDGSALYVVLSHGKNAVGAYSNIGSLSKACAGVGLDLENCTDGFASGVGPVNSIYTSTRQNDQPGANFFDDTINYFSQISQPAWRRTDANIEDIQDLSNRYVGAGISLPNADLDISSTVDVTPTDSLRVFGTDKTDGKIITNSICTEIGTDCFDPAVITGDNTIPGEGMKCPAGQYMIGIENGGPICEDEIEVRCDQDITKPIMIGMNADGTPKCVEAPESACAAATMTPCASTPAKTASLLAGADGALRPGPLASDFFATTFGDCRKVRYTCNDGAWLESATGHCTFTPTVTTTNPTCKSYYKQCGWSGLVTKKTTTLCTGGSSTTNDTSACECFAESCPKTISCRAHLGANYKSGINISYNETVTCPAGPSGARNVINDLATADKSMCVCKEYTHAIFATCESKGLSGHIRKSPPTPASFVPDDWPADLNKGAFMTRTVNPADCSFVDSPWDTSNCVCNTAKQYTKNTVVCSDPLCESPDPAPSGSSYPGVGPAQKGWDIFEHDVNTATCTRVDPGVKIYDGSCKSLGFRWTNLGTSGARADTLPAPTYYLDTGCTCDDHKRTIAGIESCFLSGDPTKTIYSCKCQ